MPVHYVLGISGSTQCFNLNRTICEEGYHGREINESPLSVKSLSSNVVVVDCC